MTTEILIKKWMGKLNKYHTPTTEEINTYKLKWEYGTFFKTMDNVAFIKFIWVIIEVWVNKSLDMKEIKISKECTELLVRIFKCVLNGGKDGPVELDEPEI